MSNSKNQTPAQTTSNHGVATPTNGTAKVRVLILNNRPATAQNSTGASTPMIFANDEMSSLVKNLVDVTKEKLEVKKKRMEIEKQILENCREISSQLNQLITLIPMRHQDNIQEQEQEKHSMKRSFPDDSDEVMIQRKVFILDSNESKEDEENENTGEMRKKV